jgi:hypothetical protein
MRVSNGVETPKELPVAGKMLVYKLMVLSPILLLMGLSVESRRYEDTFESVAYSEAEHAAVNAYIPIMRDAYPFMERTAPGDIERVRQIAWRWVDESRTGVLPHLDQVEYTDTSRDGIRGQIARTNGRLVWLLTNEGKRAAQAGDVSAAVDDALLAVELAQTAKGWDFATLQASASEQRRALEVLDQVASRLSDEERTRVLLRLRELEAVQPSIGDMTRRLRQLFVAHRLRQRLEAPLSIEDAGRLVSIANMLDNAEPDQFAAQARAQILASREMELPAIYSEVRIGHRNQRLFDHALHNLIQRLEPESESPPSEVDADVETESDGA